MTCSAVDQNNPGVGAIDDPLGDYARQFRRHLERQHYCQARITQYVRGIDALGRFMKRSNVAVNELDEGRAVDLLMRSDGSLRSKKRTVVIVRSFVRFLQALGVAQPTLPMASDTARGRLRLEYEEYLRRQRGLSERTIIHCWRFADRFLRFRFNSEEGDLTQIAPADISRFMQHLTSRGTPLRDKTPPTHLRNFFRFLFQSGKTAINLAPSVPRIAQRHGATLPRHLMSEQVDALLAAVRQDTPIGRRNYAMVLLLARLGLRAPEVIAMQIDDIDWRAGEVLIRGKGKRHDRVPLPQDVGKALAEYIHRDRLTPSRSVFVTDRAPRRPFADGQILNAVLHDAFARTGLQPPAKYIGSHVLRHSLATALVQRGASLTEIGDMLRHRSRESTMLYAKVDVDGLRSIALPWPVTGGAR